MNPRFFKVCNVYQSFSRLFKVFQDFHVLPRFLRFFIAFQGFSSFFKFFFRIFDVFKDLVGFSRLFRSESSFGENYTVPISIQTTKKFMTNLISSKFYVDLITA